ncbi:hypothetical protein [Bradyrhizobium sp. LVM 105]|uniref:hypothetical protein n=1 Tax=Bradyrhizobium sp. LVM 105 TaxID=2341115 RepID=UPI000F80D460|nr:hypothetical protein [Bradyrhizobium sp. LVM 105]RTE92815.1 hypothetical protein D6B98_15175 [Bradyrhizobium sp. LVM 105]
MRNEQEVLEVTAIFTQGPDGRASSPSEAVGAGDQAQHPLPWDAMPAAASNVPHEPSPEIKKAMLAAAYAQLMIDRLAALQNEEVIKCTGISRAELGLRVWNAPLAEVAARLRLKKHVLMRICKLYDVPTPPKGYFNTSFAQRSIRWTRVTVGAGAR